jgi:hypothetical protein
MAEIMEKKSAEGGQFTKLELSNGRRAKFLPSVAESSYFGDKVKIIWEMSVI